MTKDDRHARRALLGWLATNGPLLKGPAPAPRGAKFNPADGTSPKDPVVAAR
jgi:hypothetical protein